MPVTAKLSRKFYETLGDEVANEMVDWFNTVDLSYRTQLRELNEANYQRFESRLLEGLAVLKGELKQEIANLRVDLMGELGRETGAIRIEMQQDRAEMQRTFAEMQRSHAQGLSEIRVEMAAMESRLRVEMASQKADLLKWVFLFWLGTIAATVATRIW